MLISTVTRLLTGAIQSGSYVAGQPYFHLLNDLHGMHVITDTVHLWLLMLLSYCSLPAQGQWQMKMPVVSNCSAAATALGAVGNMS